MKEIEWNGSKIAQSGMYKNVPIVRYHEVVDEAYAPLCVSPSISSTGLRKIWSAGPKHFYSEYAANPKRKVRKKEPEHFIMGRSLHHLVLGQPYFAKEFAIRPEEFPDRKTGEMRVWNSNRLECAAWLDEQKAAGRTVLSGEMVENIKGMATEIGLHPLAPQFLRGKTERTLVWQDKDTGVWCRSRPDSIPTDSLDICDAKTTISTQWPDLVRTLDTYFYQMQAAFIRTACREALGLDMSTFTLLFIEKENPWNVRDVRLDDEDLNLGEKQNRIALNTFAKCLKEGVWPGPGSGAEGTEKLRLSEIARDRINKRLQETQ